MDLKIMGIDELRNLIASATAEIESRETVSNEMFELDYNSYKGSGKCWVANIDPKTKKILSFIDCESVKKEGSYKGTKTFLVPIIEGHAYQFRESGTKTNDSNFYRIALGGELVVL